MSGSVYLNHQFHINEHLTTEQKGNAMTEAFLWMFRRSADTTNNNKMWSFLHFSQRLMRFVVPTVDNSDDEPHTWIHFCRIVWVICSHKVSIHAPSRFLDSLKNYSEGSEIRSGTPFASTDNICISYIFYLLYGIRKVGIFLYTSEYTIY